MTDYVYKELDNAELRIRILDLFPADQEEADIHCQLQEVSLSKSVASIHGYEALSYVWGSVENPALIYVDGHPFSVTRNLNIALRHLRHKSLPRRLWVDAICINQNSEQEKSVQVLLMRRIYAEASLVLVWLGPGDRDTDSAIAFLTREAANPTNALADAEAIRPVLPGLTKVLTSPWWTRIWVFQEVVVASRSPLVICGHSQITWTDLNQEQLRWELMLNFLEEVPGIRDIHINGSQEFIYVPTAYSDHSQEERDRGINFSAMLCSTSHRLTSDARDKIYAVLGVVTDGSADLVRPDYTNSVCQVYQAATVSILNFENKFDMLLRIHTKSRRTDLPTWCPDFSTGELGAFEKGDRFYPLREQTQFEADRGTVKDAVTHNTSLGSITLSGIKVGRITTARPSSFTSDVNDNYKDLVLTGSRETAVTQGINRLRLERSEIAEEIHRVLTRTVGVQEANLRLAGGEAWRVMYAGCPIYLHGDLKPESQLSMDKSEFRDGYWLFERYLHDEQRGLHDPDIIRPWSDLIANQDISNLRNWAMVYMPRMVQTLENTSLFVTENDLYGTSVSVVEESDLLCVIFGSRLPVVLRPQRNKYRLVAFANVPAIMQGELFAEGAQKGRDRMTFEIV